MQKGRRREVSGGGVKQLGEGVQRGALGNSEGGSLSIQADYLRLFFLHCTTVNN